MSQTYQNCIKCRLLVEPPKFTIQPPPELPADYLKLISNNDKNLTQKLEQLKCLFKKQIDADRMNIIDATTSSTDNLSITNLFIFIICAILFIFIFFLLIIFVIKYFRTKWIHMTQQIDYINRKNKQFPKIENATLSSSDSSELSNADTDTNLLEIIQTTKKFYLNPILQQQHIINLPDQNVDYNYYQREYEEINELNTLSLKRQCLTCHHQQQHHHQQQQGFNYSSSSTSSTSSTSQLIRNSTKTVNQFDCISCGKNLITFPILPQRQSLHLSKNSAFKPISTATHQTEIQIQPASYLYYAC